MKRWTLLLGLMLGACGQADTPAPEPTPTVTMAAERTLVASDFDPAAIGALVGEAEEGAELTAMGKPLGTVASAVHCLAEGGPCDEGTPGAVYTYVHRIRLAAVPEGAPSPTPTALDTPHVVEIGPTLFRTTEAARGFNLAVGYARAEAEAALGDPEAIKVTLDREQIVWRVTGGEGWKPGATITVFWQSTLPPGDAAKAYLLEVDGRQADVTAPFPAEEKTPSP